MAKLNWYGADIDAPDEINLNLKHDDGSHELVRIPLEYISGNRVVLNPGPVLNAIQRKRP